MSDVLDRLRTANPVADPEAVRAGGRPLLPLRPRAGRRPATARRVAALGALCAAAALAIGLPGDRSSRPGGLLAPAVAATLAPGGSILHIVSRTSQSGPRGAKYALRTDVWLMPGGRGRVRTVRRNGDSSSFALTGRHARDPAAVLRGMLADGTLKPTGRATLDGRAVETFQAVQQDTEIVLYADAATMRPVRSIIERGSGDDRLTAVTDFLRFERLADTPENRRRVDEAG